MIENPLLLILFLVFLEAALLSAEAHPATKNFLRFPPAVFWIYFLPMIFSSFGLLPREHFVYARVPEFLLPASLVLLLVGIDLRKILRAGPAALGMMLVGSASIIAGSAAVVFLFKRWIPDENVIGFAPLAASWMGGSANMVAVKEALQVPDQVFLPMVVVDTFGAYTWMGLLIAFAAFQSRVDRWSSARQEFISAAHDEQEKEDTSKKPFWSTLPVLFAIAGSGIYLSRMAGSYLPVTAGISSQTWVVLTATTLGILVSLTRLRNLTGPAASRSGYALLYFILICIGARADLNGILSAPVFLLAGFTWLFFHGVIMVIAAKIFRIPIGLAAAASQANVGGPISAPIVAAVYDPRLAPVGLLLGIFGNILGTYLGLFCARILTVLF